jgi:hypothetical protein
MPIPSRVISDGDEVIVYTDEATGKNYVRFPDEFTPDRFEELGDVATVAPTFGIERAKAALHREFILTDEEIDKMISIVSSSLRLQSDATVAPTTAERAYQSHVSGMRPKEIPLLENCGEYLAHDNKGQWHYINHAGTWQGYQGPTGGQWEDGFRSIVTLLVGARTEFEIKDIVDMVQAVKSDLEEFRARPAAIADIPEYDGTDGAHPAWWRGNDRGFEQVVHLVAKWLTGDLDAAIAGKFNPQLDRVRTMIVRLKERALLQPDLMIIKRTEYERLVMAAGGMTSPLTMQAHQHSDGNLYSYPEYGGAMISDVRVNDTPIEEFATKAVQPVASNGLNEGVDALTKYWRGKPAPVPMPDVLTKTAMADALDAFWNVALGNAQASGDYGTIRTIGAMADGFASIAKRLRDPA